LKDIDPDLAKNLIWMLENDISNSDLCLDFTYSYVVLGE
jgi:E3 ubiquitin-protein ligase NEDD4